MADTLPPSDLSPEESKSRKRKRDSDSPTPLSNNLHSAKARARYAKMKKDPVQARLQKAITNDNSAKKVLKGKLYSAEWFKKLPAAEQTTVFQARWLDKYGERTREGKSRSAVEKELGLGIYANDPAKAKFDDGDPQWIPAKFKRDDVDDEIEQELLARFDDIAIGEDQKEDIPDVVIEV
ncbi:hypothetical protein G7Y89_g15709 [Cudoniella acicularis]|uniref:Uncharacterized protein n=1 Tax=Cudoniella acicularis TaxID=354080 RepID=A0A8H4VJQ4_9HELO|nr:hypothetical protein G7Y89_g15709 [Cudoniella acicularis]